LLHERLVLFRLVLLVKEVISIHALREEGDMRCRERS
jgi:hypothetical protein